MITVLPTIVLSFGFVFQIGKAEGAKVLTGGVANDVVDGGFYVKPTILHGTNDMQALTSQSTLTAYQLLS